MAIRRSRKSRYTWFPIYGTEYVEVQQPEVTYFESSMEIAGGNGTAGNPQTIPLLRDDDIQADDLGSQISLRDRVEGKDYAIERIVGKVWAALPQEAEAPENSVVSRAIVGMGIAVLPVNDDDGQPAVEPADYAPLFSNNSSQPWMWRRTWTLYNNLAELASGAIITGPTNIGSFGSVMDGGHVDVKSGRRVSREQRLFFIAQAAILAVSSGSANSKFIDFGYDFRILGAMRRARNTSTFK